MTSKTKLKTMPEAKRKPSAKQVIDVHKPGKTPAEDTSKPVIVNNRQILRDPMVTNESTTPVPEVKGAPDLPSSTPMPGTVPGSEQVVEAKADVLVPEAPAEAEEPAAEPKHNIVIAPLTIEEPAKTETEVEPEAEPAATEKQDQPILAPDSSAEAVEAEAEEAEAKRQVELQKLADSKKYFLQINAIEQKRAEQFIALGILLGLVLALAWLDISLDAGLIHIDNIHPVTHFFSN
ncbi:MAG: hypothetical protein JWO41_364 [Candidatus Saccharibacteria bacterium]|nr:hypothetical protein [Candidatus Saccharibacteria bacterium]